MACQKDLLSYIERISTFVAQSGQNWCASGDSDSESAVGGDGKESKIFQRGALGGWADLCG